MSGRATPSAPRRPSAAAARTLRDPRNAVLAAALLLVGVALFHDGGIGDAPLMWLGGGALVVLLAALVVLGPPGSLATLLPLAALAAWCAASIGWSTMPDASWEYADRALVYLLFAALGLWLALRTRELAFGLAVLFAAVVVWALAGKVLPFLAGSFSGTPRLSAPLGLWNQLALVGDFALGLALWLAGRRRVAGTLLAYLWLVALVLTVSRGGIVVAVLVAVAWIALSGEGFDAFTALLAAALPAAPVAGIAFALKAVTGSGASNATRWWQGLLFGGLVLLGALAAALLAARPWPRPTPRLRRAALGLAGVVAVAVLAVGALKAHSAWHQFTSSTEVSNSAARFTSTGSNFRWVWWKRAWKAFTLHPLEGTGAGTFELTNFLYRTSDLDSALEPHELPLQFLSETGVVGFLLLLGAFATLLRAAGRRRGHELALGLLLPAYLLHSLVDIDWDFAAVSLPALLAAGALAGGSVQRRRLAPPALLLAGAAALALFAALLLPWLGNRLENEAGLELNPAQAIANARSAHRADPLLVGPLWTEAENEPINAAGNAAALALFRQAARMQPQNPYTWLELGQFELTLGPPGSIGCPRLAYPALQTFTNLDDHSDPATGGARDKDRALAYVNSGKADPAYCTRYAR